MFSVRGQHSGVWGHLSSHLSSHLLLAVVLCQALHVGGWPVRPTGRIKEDGSYNHMYYVGENLTVQCIKFSNFTGDVFFQQGNVNYNQEYVTQINTTHALLDKPVTDDAFKETTLSCADGDGLVATATIYNDYAPREATDLKMVWLNEQFLLINWAFNNTSYKNGHTNRLIQVTGEWSYNASNANGWYVCYSGDLNNAACNVTGISNEWVTVHVRVNITNVIRKDLVSTVFPGVPIRDHVKPLPVKSVKVTALNSSAVRVHVTSDYFQQVYNITYNTTWGTTVMTAKTADKSFDVTGLHPDYRYRFSVSSKYDTHRGYLSDPVNYVTRMPEDAPAAGPVVTPGGFYLDRSSCSSEADSAKKKPTAYVYFQELADEDKNGNIVSYTATVVVDGTNKTYTQSGTPRTVKLDSVPCDGNFDVTLRAHTAVGPSPGAVLHVPQWTEGNDGSVDKLMLKLSDGKITAEWEATPSLPGESVLLYYCNKTSADPNMCQSAILHVNISTDSGSQLLPKANANMKFGMAAISKDSSTKGIKTKGIQFTDCLYDPATDPGNVPLQVSAFPQSDDILVSWKAVSACDSTRRYIIFNFEIEVCNTETRTSDPDRCKMDLADASSNSYRLVGIAKDFNYSVRMRANTTYANRSLTDFTEPVFATVQSTVFKLSSGEITGIVMGVLVVVFVLAMLVFCFCRDKFRAVKAKFSRSADIPAPTPRRVPREFHPAGQARSSSRGGISNQGFVPVGTSAPVTHQRHDSQDSGYIGQDNSPTTPRQVALQGTDSVPPTGPTDLTQTDHTQSASPDRNVASTADVTLANGDIQGDDSGCIVSSGELSPAVDIIMANGNIQGDDSGCIVSPGEEPAECKPAHIPVPACFGGGESDEGLDTVGKGTLKDFPSLSDTGSNSYVRFSTEDCPRQGGEQLSGEPAQVVINFSKGKGPATFEPVVGVVHVALSDPGTTPTAVNSGNGVDSEAKLDPNKEDNGWAAPAETVTNPTQDFTQDSAMNSVDREVTVSVTEQQGLGSYSQISSSGVTEKLHGQGTQEEEPSDERLEASPATVSPGYVTHDVTLLQAQSGPTRHVHQQDASDGLKDGAAPGRLEEPSPSPDVSLSSSTPGGRFDEPCNPANVNPEPERPIQQELSLATGHLPSVLSTPPAADSPPRPPQQPVEQGEGAVLDPQIDRDIDPAPQGRVIDPAPQGHLDQEPATDIPPLSAMPGGYVLRHATSPDVSLPCPPPVQDEHDSEGGSQHTEKDAARSEESGSSLSDSTPSQSSNGGGYVPLDKVEKMTLILDSSAAMVTADESDAGGREGGGGRGGFEGLDSGYSSPNSAPRSPQWRSSPGFTSVQETPHNDNDDGTFNMTPAEPARAATKKGVAKQRHGERTMGEPARAATKKGVATQRHGERTKGENAGNEGVAKQRHGERTKGENAGKERGSLGGALVMSSSPKRQAPSGYVERNDVFAAPSETSA